MAPRSAPDLTDRPTSVVGRVRIRYAKRGRLRFTSHRDITRAFERALRRAGVPMAYSSGFTAHPKVSWVGAAPTGAASEAEYVELGLAEEVDLTRLRQALDAALPPGLDVLEVVAAAGGSLPQRIDASRWLVRLPGVPPEEAARAVAALLAAESAPVERLTKDGRRSVDVRAALASAAVVPGQGSGGVSRGTGHSACAILDLVVRMTTPAVRPDDVLGALRRVAGLTPPVAAEVTRLAQGRLAADGSIADPLDPDRAASDESG